MVIFSASCTSYRTLTASSTPSTLQPSEIFSSAGTIRLQASHGVSQWPSRQISADHHVPWKWISQTFRGIGPTERTGKVHIQRMSLRSFSWSIWRAMIWGSERAMQRYVIQTAGFSFILNRCIRITWKMQCRSGNQCAPCRFSRIQHLHVDNSVVWLIFNHCWTDITPQQMGHIRPKSTVFRHQSLYVGEKNRGL